MLKLKQLLKTIFCHSAAFLILTSVPVSAALIYIFINKNDKSAAAYAVYLLSAYCLVSCVYSSADIIRRFKSEKKKLAYKSAITAKLRSSKLICRYIDNRHFRGEAGIYISLAVDTLYAIFRAVTGMLYGSVWFLSLAVYHGVLGLIRLYLAYSYRKNERISDDRKKLSGYRCYRKTGILLFLLNVPMGSMILLMIHTNSGFRYPGYIVYLSAIYTFYAAITAVMNIIRYRRLGDPILSAAKALNLISSAMSLLGLQTAMIAAFSKEDDAFRRIMNTATGTDVFILTSAVAVYMIVHSVTKPKNERSGEHDKIRE